MCLLLFVRSVLHNFVFYAAAYPNRLPLCTFYNIGLQPNPKQTLSFKEKQSFIIAAKNTPCKDCVLIDPIQI